MKMRALSDYLVAEKDAHKVYIFNPDYSFGVSVQKAAEAMLKDRRPDLRIVGAERVPLAKVKDFTPVYRQVPGRRRGCGGHRQLGCRPGAAGEGGGR